MTIVGVMTKRVSPDFANTMPGSSVSDLDINTFAQVKCNLLQRRISRPAEVDLHRRRRRRRLPLKDRRQHGMMKVITLVKFLKTNLHK